MTHFPMCPQDVFADLVKEVPRIADELWASTGFGSAQTPQHRAGKTAKEIETTACTVPSPPPPPQKPYARKVRSVMSLQTRTALYRQIITLV